jgi:hypothetical protein
MTRRLRRRISLVLASATALITTFAVAGEAIAAVGWR